MAAVKGDKVQICTLEIQAGGHDPHKPQGSFASIADPHRPGNEVILGKNAVVELHLQVGNGVLQENNQGLGLLAVKSRKSLQGVLPLPDLIVPVAKVRHMASVLKLHLQRGHPEISDTAGGVLLGQGIQGIGAAVSRLTGIGRKAPICILN
jgi:hypothetical protein